MNARVSGGNSAPVQLGQESRTCTSSVFFCLAVAIAVGAASAQVIMDAPGHVYSEGGEVLVSGGSPEDDWTLTDWHGQVFATGRFDAFGRVGFGVLPVGYYHMKVRNEDATFAVVPNPEGRTFDHRSFYGVDSAQSWISRPGSFTCPWYENDTYRLVSDLLFQAGIPHVRDRLSASEVNPEPGRYEYKHYMYNADLLRTRGILVSGMFHDVPEHMDRIEKLPRNLAGLYAFCRDTSAAFGDRMGDWEFWNEQDVTYAPEPVWDYVAALKAAYLGFKAGRSALTVLPGAVCFEGRNPYDAGMYANDAAKYADVFNFHTYAPIASYPAIFANIRDFMAKHGIGTRAIWMTESGTNLEGLSKNEGAKAGQKAHSPEQELIQAEFYAKSQIAFQMQGVARNYFFVFGAYNERLGAKDWGVMRRDGTVKPTYAAMSTITHELISARLVGEIALGDKFKGYVFSQPNGTQTLAFWSVSPVDTSIEEVGLASDCAAELRLPISPEKHVLVDLCGRRSIITTNVVTATRYPAYIHGLHGLKPDVAPFPQGRPTPYSPTKGEDLTVIIRADLNNEDFSIAGHKSVAELHADTGRIHVQVWNLDSKPKCGSICAKGGSLMGLPSKIALSPMDHVEFDCVYSPKRNSSFMENLVIVGTFEGKRTSRLTIPVRNEKVFLSKCRKVELLNWRNPNAWKRNTSADEYSVTWDESEQAIRFDVSWSKPGDRWFYPIYKLKLPEEMFDDALVLEFQVKSVQDKPENDFRCQFLMLRSSMNRLNDRFVPYLAPINAWETRRIDLSTGAPGCGPGSIGEFRLGANPKGSKCTFWVRGLRVLKDAVPRRDTSSVNIPIKHKQ